MKRLFFALAMLLVTLTGKAQNFKLGDVNRDGLVNVTDAMMVVDIVFNGYRPLEVSSDNIVVENGASTSVNVSSGYGPYTIISSDDRIATATLSGATITITGKAIGKATVTVTDMATDNTKTINVTVGSSQTAYLSCPDNHHPHMIDLGLPSGTKWACCNMDTDHPSKHSPANLGGYFSWGETEAPSKTSYDWSSYIYCDGSMETCHDLGADIAGSQYDVAHVKWGGKWAMPSFDQINELIANTKSVWTTQDGVNGRVFTGKNGASIFMPAGGHYTSDGITDVGVRGRYWTSTMSKAYNRSASIFRFSSTGRSYDFQYRCNGSNVRPVYNADLGLSLSSVEVEMGKRATAIITSGSGSYTISSSDERMATATLSGSTITITGKAIGQAIVTVTDMATDNTKTINVTVGSSQTAYLSCPDDHHPHMIDLGLPSGTKWACCNVDADHPEKHNPANYGGYFSWGETEAASKATYDWNSYIYCDGAMETCHDLGADIAGSQYDVAHVKWGGKWAMPSFDQINELIANTKSVWTTQDGVNGRVFTGKNGASIFMPAGGHYTSDGITDVGVRGRYWTSTLSKAYNRSASIFRFSSTGRSYDFQYRCNGSNVRPISK